MAELQTPAAPAAGEHTPAPAADGHAVAPADGEAAALLGRAWELCYLDPMAARAIGARLAAAGGAAAASGWLHVALVDLRLGPVDTGLDALARARAGFSADPHGPDRRGLALCDEAQAIALRRTGDYEGAAYLQAQIDARDDVQRDAMHAFLAANSRGITATLRGDQHTALRLLYAAADAAGRTGWLGPRLTALSNLGDTHMCLSNWEDARRLSEQALALARAAGAPQVVLTAALNLIVIHHAEGHFPQARAMTEFLLTHPELLPPGALQRNPLQLALGHLCAGEIDDALRYLDGDAVVDLGDGDGMTFWAWLKARCLLARHDAAGARALGERILAQRRPSDQPNDMMALYGALADACEQAGDAVAALSYLRRSHALYEELMGRGARARYIALEVSHELAQAKRERDLAVDSRRTAEDDRQRLAELNVALQAQIAETERLHGRLREQALRDPLTGLHNRRYLFEIAPGLMELTRRQAGLLCVVLIDLDHFKLLNDTYGHHAGDLVLQRFAALLTQMLRRSDVVCRHGGEEFVALMPDIDAEGAQAMLRRLLDAFQAQQAEVGRRRLPSCSFSAGIAVFPRHGSTLEQLLSRADRGLYAAKHRGRARIEVVQTGFGALG
ncbi:MAG: diguanylate cyclase [Burkholderiales bacterium]|nr:diguanylate cyclase [Burkholderiales bacterium]